MAGAKARVALTKTGPHVLISLRAQGETDQHVLIKGARSSSPAETAPRRSWDVVLPLFSALAAVFPFSVGATRENARSAHTSR